MSRFKDSFEIGIKAHENAERATLEVRDVLNAFASEVSEASGDAISINRTDKDLVGAFSRKLISYLTPLDKLPSAEPFNMITAEAVLPKGLHVSDSSFKLADYSLSPEGYPVAISYSDVAVRCHDRPSLEAALEEMLQHPDTGGKLRRLIEISRGHRRKISEGSLKDEGLEHSEPPKLSPDKTDE
jgi:hypothetical protein